MAELDLLLIVQSEVVNYEKYSNLPLDRIDIYKDMIFPRMVYFGGAFHSHVDLINILYNGSSYLTASPMERRNLLSVWNLPRFAGMHLANYLLQYGIITEMINNIDSEWDRFREIYAAAEQPPVVGISSTFHLSFSEISRLVKRIRAEFPDSVVVVGGAFVSEQAINKRPQEFEAVMHRLNIDYIFYGFHSEIDLRNYFLWRKGKAHIQDVANLAYLTGDKKGRRNFRITPERWNPPILEESPALWHELRLPFVGSTVQMRTACGCPFRCAFCSYPSTAKKYQVMSVDAVEQTLQSLLRIPHVNKIVFLDDTFNVPTERFKRLCNIFTKYDFEWYSFLRVQFVDEDIVKLMRDSGCRAVYLGIESANDDVLMNMNKKARRVDFERGISLLNKHGIATVGAFVLGFPGETAVTINEDIDLIESAGLDYYTLKEFYYMPHTSVHLDREKYNLSGSANNWSHDTMDSRTASAHKMRMFQEIKNSTFVDPDISLWYLILLRESNFSFDRITAVQQQINHLVRDQMSGVFDDAHPALSRLQQMLTQ